MGLINVFAALYKRNAVTCGLIMLYVMQYAYKLLLNMLCNNFD